MKSNFLKSIQQNLNERKEKADKSSSGPKLNLSKLKERLNDGNTDLNFSNR